jgi:hypothetical protein
MIGKTTEKAIKAWLELPVSDRGTTTFSESGRIELWKFRDDSEPMIVARFSIASIVAKRYSKRKKVKK